MPSRRSTLLAATILTAVSSSTPARADDVERDRERLAIQSEIQAADHASREEAIDRYREAGERYLDLWRRYGQAPCEAKQAGCARMEEILYNAARAFQAGRDLPKAIAARQILLDPRYNLHHTELARKAVYEIGYTYQAIAEYDQAASWYERYAAESPKADRAPEALTDAIVLRLGLSQDARAVEDAARFNKAYGASKPALSAQIAFAIGAHFVEKEDWAEARRRLAGAMSWIDRDGTLDVRIQAHALLGRALAKLGKAADAAAEYAKVRAFWSDPAAMVRRIREQTGDEDRKLAKALTGVGEAMFFAAEEKRRAADALRLPAYTGTDKRGDIAAYAAKLLVPAIHARRAAIEEAEKAYKAVLEIQPMPPPRWAIPAVARVAHMRSRILAEIRALPAPKAWKPDVRAAWRDMLIDASELDEAIAHGANKRCLDMSVKWQWSDASVQRCATWLERHHPEAFPRLDEILPKPRNVAFGLDAQIAPEPDRRGDPSTR